MKNSLLFLVVSTMAFMGCNGSSDSSVTHGAGVYGNGNCDQNLVNANNALVMDATKITFDSDAGSPLITQDLATLANDCQAFLQAYPDTVCNAVNLTDGSTTVVSSSSIQAKCNEVASSGSVAANPFNPTPSSNYKMTLNGNAINPACSTLDVAVLSVATGVYATSQNAQCSLNFSGTQNANQVEVSSLTLSSVDGSETCYYAGVLNSVDGANFTGTVTSDDTSGNCPVLIINILKQ